MKIQQYITLTLTMSLLGTFSVGAQAHNCGEPSPLMISLGKQYTELSYSPETSPNDASLDTADLIDLLELSRLHSGHGLRVECFGNNGRWEEDTTTFDLTDIDYRENNKGSVMLSAYEESEKDLKREVIELPVAQNWQATSDNEYRTSYLFRLRNYTTGSSRAAEIALSIQSGEKAVIVTEVLYINGLKVDWVSWNLDS